MQAEGRGQIGVTIGVCAYNEAGNIENLLKALLGQKLEVARIQEIIVVASGCTDETTEIVSRYSEADERVALVTEPERKGKVSAINEILERARGDVIVLESADTIPSPRAVEFLVRPFNDPRVGVVAARPIPVGGSNSFMGSMVHTLWRLHHEVSMLEPKTGEMFAFRPTIGSIPSWVGADEDWIRHRVESNGSRVWYEPAAVVYNAGPGTLGEFVRQRVRWNILELRLNKLSSFRTPTWRIPILMQAIGNYTRGDWSRIAPLFSFLMLEFVVRSYSLIASTLPGSGPLIWEELPSTKVLEVDEQNNAEQASQR